MRADPERSGRKRLSRRAATLLLLASLACSGSGGRAELPDYARGRVEIAPSSEAPADLVPYRTLTRDDFRADAPPLVLPHDAPPHGAMTCARVMPHAKLATRGSGGEQELRLLDLGFAAAMDRSCSHWSAASPLPEAYVLEHEQIHFAIVELEARRLNARADALSEELVYRGAGAEQKIRTGLNDVLQASARRIAEQGLAFDEAASMKYAPEVQRDWLARMTRELAAYPPSGAR